MVKNITCDPTPPVNIESTAQKMLDVLLKGIGVNRKNCFQLGITEWNSSVHSIAAYLRNKKYVPLISRRDENSIVTYIMSPEEIKRYKAPELRLQQCEEMKLLVEHNRYTKLAKQLFNYFERLKTNTKLWSYLNQLSLKPDEMVRKIDALLKEVKSVN